MVFKKEVFRSDLFKNFISSIEKQKHKDDIILNYEIGLSQLLLKNGYRVAAFIDKPCQARINGSLFFQDKLNPLIKTRVVRQSGWFLGMLLSSWYNNFEIDYPKNLIFEPFPDFPTCLKTSVFKTPTRVLSLKRASS